MGPKETLKCDRKRGDIMEINEIEKLTYEEAKNIALEILTIKDHQCIFTNIDDDFGYSVLVFSQGKHIYYANDYELHHSWVVEEKGIEGLREYYIEEMERKLYTDVELMEDVKTYDEYVKKNHFLRNYYIMRYDYESIFFIGSDEERKKRKEKIIEKFPYYNPVSFCYVADEKIIDRQKNILRHLESEYKKLQNNDDTFRKMVRKELYNHESCITGDFKEALSALGITFGELTDTKKKIVKEELQRQIEEC
jgi:hypothetical protein